MRKEAEESRQKAEVIQHFYLLSEYQITFYVLF
jgi:hypothetical protein